MWPTSLISYTQSEDLDFQALTTPIMPALFVCESKMLSRAVYRLNLNICIKMILNTTIYIYVSIYITPYTHIYLRVILHSMGRRKERPGYIFVHIRNLTEECQSFRCLIIPAAESFVKYKNKKKPTPCTNT